MTAKKKSDASRSVAPAAESGVYRERIIDHYRNPRNFGSFSACDVVRQESNFSCGDDLEFFLKIGKGRVKDIRFQGQGCALSVAAASLLTEKVVGMKLVDIGKMDSRDVVAMVGIGEIEGSRLRCATLGLKGIQTAVAEWKKRH
jgi:nitrogen fixation NifU-like protein